MRSPWACGQRPRPPPSALSGPGLQADDSDDALLLTTIAGTAPVMPTIVAFLGCRTLDHPSLISEQLLPLLLPVFPGRFALPIVPSGNHLFIGKRYRYKERHVGRFFQQLYKARIGSDNRAFLHLYGTTLPCVARQNREG